MNRHRPVQHHTGDVLWTRMAHLVRAQPGVFGGLIVVLAWFALNWPGLGTHGLWDPWEMDRAHVARQMTSPPRVLVIEGREPGEKMGPIARWLTLRYQDSITIVVPDGPPARRRKEPPSKIFAAATEALDKGIWHLILVDVPGVVQDPGADPQVEPLVIWLDRARARHAATPLVLVQPLEADRTAEEYDALLRQTAARVRIELAGRELGGRTWGKPGPFRRSLIKEIQAAKKGGYRLFPELTPEPTDNFIDEAFWRAAEKRKLVAQMTRSVTGDASEQIADAQAFALTERIIPWPRGDAFAAVLSDFATADDTASEAANSAVAGLEAHVDHAFWGPTTRASFQRKGVSYSVPPLEYWLMAGAFESLGFSELAARLPSFLLGFFGLLIILGLVGSVWGGMASTLAGLVLTTSPLFFAQARSVAGEMGFTVALALIVSGFIYAAHHNRGGVVTWVALVVGGVAAFLAQGVFGLLIPAAIAVVYVLIARDFRVAVLLPTLGLCAALGLTWWSVIDAPPSSFWSHFGLEQSLFSWSLDDSDRPVRLNFDILVRQIGFGAAPWSALLPFAFGLLALRLRDKKDPASLIVLLWFFVPYIAQSMVAKNFNHLVFPGIPAAAVAVGLLLLSALQGQRFGAVMGVCAAIVVGLLLSNAKKSPEPLTAWLTADPPLGGSGTDNGYPEALKLPTTIKLALTFIAALILIHGARVASRARLVLSFMSRPRPLAWSLGAVAAIGAFRILGGMETQIAASFNTRGGQVLELVHRLYVRSLFYWRPEGWALITLLAGAGLALLGWHTRLIQRTWAWLRGWLLTGFVSRSLALALAAAGSVSAASAVGGDPLEALTTHGSLGLGIAGIAAGLIVLLSFVRRLPALFAWVIGSSVATLGLIITAWTTAAAADPELTGAPRGLALAALGLSVLPNVLTLIRGARPGRILTPLRRFATTFVGDRAALVLVGASLLILILVPVLLGAPDGAVMAATLRSPPFWFGLVGIVLVRQLGGGSRWLRLASAALLLACATHVLILSEAAGVLLFPGALPEALLSDRVVAVILVAVLGLLFAWLGAAAHVADQAGKTRSALAHAWIVITTLWLSYTIIAGAGVFPDESGWLEWATTRSPVWRLGWLALFGWTAIWVMANQAGGVIFSDASLLAPLRRIRPPAVALLGGAAIVGWILAGLISQLFLESGLTQMDFLLRPEAQRPAGVALRNRGAAAVALVPLAALIGLHGLRFWLKERAAVAVAVAAGAGLSLVAIWTAGLVGKWTQLESAVQAAGAEPFLQYLFWGSRTTKAVYALLILLMAIGIGARLPALIARLRQPRAVRDLLVALGLGLVVAIGLALAGRVPWSVVTIAAALVVAMVFVLTLNQRIHRLDPIIGRLRVDWRLQASVVAVLVSLILAGLVGLPGGLALLSVPVIAIALARTSLAQAAPELRAGRRLFLRGCLVGLAALPVVLAPPLLGWILGLDHMGAAIGHGFGLLLAVLVAWAGIVFVRRGLGIADVVERAGVLAPFAFVLAWGVMLDMARLGGVARPSSVGLVLAAVGLLGLLALGFNVLLRFTPATRIPELIERPGVFVPVLAVAVACFAFFYNQKLVTALSFHVSQKHILDTVADAEGGQVPEGALFQHGLGSGAGSSRNFYTKDIPAVADVSAALTALQGQRDQVLTLTRPSGGRPDFVVARGFAPDNDKDLDGLRDYAADAGIAQGLNLETQTLEDPSKEWQPDQWIGFLLIDSEGWRMPITNNTATTLTYDATKAQAPKRLAARKQKRKGPAFDSFTSERNHYVVDHPEAADHGATGMEIDRLYFLLPKIGDHAPAYSDKGSFSDLNHRFRKLSKDGGGEGRHLAVLDDRSSRILLATSRLKPGEQDHNWLKEAMLSEQALLKLASEGGLRGFNAAKPLDGVMTWDGTLALLGWSMKDYAVSKGKQLSVSLYFRVLKPVPHSNKIFLHLDRSGHRIHSDHWPLAVSKGEDHKHCIGCFQTNHWLPGDIVVDTFEREVPFGAPSGETEVFLGLFNPQGDKRMKITAWDEKIIRYGGKDDRARIGSFVVR